MTDPEPTLLSDGGYPWNVEIDVEGVTFEGPGMADKSQARAITELVADAESVSRAEVVRQ